MMTILGIFFLKEKKQTKALKALSKILSLSLFLYIKKKKKVH